MVLGGHRIPSVLLLLGALIAALGVSCASEVDVESLYVQSNSEDYEERFEARQKLAELVKEQRVEPFARGLRSDNPETRGQSILHLMAIRSPEAREALIGELELSRRFSVYYNPVRLVPVSSPSDSRIMIAHIILMNGGHPKAVEVLADTYGKEPDVEARVGTVYALGALYDRQTIPILEKGLKDPDERVVRAAVEGLTQLEVPDLLDKLIGALKDPSESVRANSASALSGFPGEKTSRVLVEVMQDDPSPSVRKAALGSLGNAGVPAAFEPVLKLLRSGQSDSEMKAKAATVLGALTGQEFGEDVAGWTRWWNSNRANSPRP